MGAAAPLALQEYKPGFIRPAGGLGNHLNNAKITD